MKPERSLSELAARALSTDAEREREVSPDARRKAVEAMSRAMRARNQRRRLRRNVVAVTAVAASIAFAITFGRKAFDHGPMPTSALVPSSPAASAMFVRGAPVIVRGGARMAVSNGLPLEAGDRVLVEPGSRTTVALPSGTSIAVGEHSELVFASPAPLVTFELGSGSVHADVAKLLPGERFVIRTSDAEVEVHGTSFDVVRVPSDPGCGHGTSTRVNVREGIVAVRAGGTETFVRANESWPPDCPSSTTGSPPAAPTATTSAQVEPNAVLPIHDGRSEHLPASTLALQNDLFEKAIGRRRAGDVTGALAGFDELLTRYPSSHLAQAAMGERMKLLRGVDKARARAAAREYLQRYPNGFARKDAELLLTGD